MSVYTDRQFLLDDRRFYNRLISHGLLIIYYINICRSIASFSQNQVGSSRHYADGKIQLSAEAFSSIRGLRTYDFFTRWRRTDVGKSFSCMS